MLDEKYRLDQLLEVGGMGAVYVGTHTKLQKQVAIKVLRRELAQIPDMIERFQREAIAATRNGHENIVNVSDLGTGRDGSPFLVMEYLNGHTLAARIRQGGAMAIATACGITREILDAISAAHHAGIIHRDLKPENVFIVRGTRGESIKILDFGISRVMEAQGEASENRLTYTGQVMGTPYYMAPEQAAGRSDLGPPVDVYATGVILYEMLSGVVPFEAGNYNTIIYKVLAGQYEPLSKRLTGVPPELESIVARAMSLQPEARFATANEFAAALEPFAYGSSFGGLHTPAPGSVPYSGSSGNMPVLPGSTPRMPVAHSHAATTPRGEPTHAAPRKRWLLVTVAALALGGAAVAGIVLASQSGDDAEEQPAATTTKATAPAPAADAPPTAAAPTPAVAEAKVVIRFEVDPPDAVVTADGEPVTGGELVRPMSDGTVEIAVSREGYAGKTRSVSLAESRTVEVILEKDAAPAPAAAPTKKRSASKKKKSGEESGTKPDRIIGDSPYD
jgi:serine/threonine-protein kinase